MAPEWFKKRSYRHFDDPVKESPIDLLVEPSNVAQHAFLPLIRYTKSERRYKLDSMTRLRKIKSKDRPICYASHKDACIYTYYAFQLNEMLEKKYRREETSDHALAYRKGLGANYNFASDAYVFACDNSPVTIMAFDVEGFFDNLDHSILKSRLKSTLGVDRLPEDWYKLFKRLTRFHYVKLSRLKSHPDLNSRFEPGSYGRIAPIARVAKLGIPIIINQRVAKGRMCGIPQGTPISAVLSNVYMTDFDLHAKIFCDNIGAYYRRYSDDILVICKPQYSEMVEQKIAELISNEKLVINSDKTEIAPFGHSMRCLDERKHRDVAQYLGFKLAVDGPYLREATMSRQWRKVKWAIKRTTRIGARAVRAGKAPKIYTRKLRKQIQYIRYRRNGAIRPVRNFPSYARTSATAFRNGSKIIKQAKRLERNALVRIGELKETGRNEVQMRRTRTERLSRRID